MGCHFCCQEVADTRMRTDIGPEVDTHGTIAEFLRKYTYFCRDVFGDVNSRQ
jgi:hypothetical protein